jgi:arylsulfatase A-like enzyme
VHPLRDSEVTLAELLAGRGYATGAFAGGPWLAPGFGLLQGYETRVAEAQDLKGTSGRSLSDAAIRWIGEVPRERPLHLLVNYFDPHAPYRPPLEFLRGEEGTHPERASDRALYEAEVRSMDHEIGRLLEGLRGAGRYAGALVVVVSDHGELLGEHGGLRHHGYWLFEELVRVPLLVRLPGARDAGSVVEAPVSIVDVLPLVAGELGLALPADLDGVPVGERRLVLAEFFRNPGVDELHGVRVDRDLVAAIRWPWKLLVDERGGRELYRLDAGSGEDEPVSGSAEELDLLAELQAARSVVVAPASAPAPAEVDRPTAERLRELGYLE